MNEEENKLNQPAEETEPKAKEVNPYLGEINSGDEDDDEENEGQAPAKSEELPEKAWYVINTMAQKENLVKERLEKRAKAFNMEDKIFRIIVANYEEQVLDKDGNPKKKKDKATGQMVPDIKIKNYYPGYIFVEMIMTDETWFVVRNTEGVSGITGSSGKGAKPFPIPREEIEPILKRMKIEDPDIYSEYKKGDLVKVLNGIFAGAEGEIIDIDPEKGSAKVQIMMFGRPTTYDVSFSDIERAPENPDFNEGN